MDEWLKVRLNRRYPKADRIIVGREQPYHGRPTEKLKIWGMQDGKPFRDTLMLTLTSVKE